MDKYLKRVKNLIIEKTGAEPEDVTDESYLEDDLNIGEMELLEIIAILEEEYDIEFTEEEKENLESVMDIVEAVAEKAE